MVSYALKSNCQKWFGPVGGAAKAALHCSPGEVVQPFQNGLLNLTTPLKAAGTTTVNGKPVNASLNSALNAAGRSNSIMAAHSGPRATGELRASAANDGGVPIPSNYEYGSTNDALHDYCTFSPDEYDASYGSDTDFRGACARHDMCYEANKYKNGHNIDAYAECNRQLKSDLITVCNNVYSGSDPRRWDYVGIAHMYFDAVVVFHPTEWNHYH